MSVLMEIPGDVRRFAEDPIAEGPLWRSCRRVERDGYVLWFGPSYYPGLAIVQRVRLGDVDRAVDEVRASVGSRVLWQIGPSATPSDVVERLRARGLRPADEPVLKALALCEPPQEVPEGVEVRPVSSFEEFQHFMRVQQAAFNEGSSEASKEAWEAERDDPDLVTYLAYVDGEPVSAGRATFGPYAVALNGGGTVPDARGRGAYRAVVGARWDAAIARGTPYLVTTARPTSEPILRKMGFVDVCDIHTLVDEGS